MNHLRRKLTAFNTAITGAILAGIALLCLFLSERNTRAAAFQNFSDTLSTASAYISGQNQVSVTWLRQIESAGRVQIFIRDNGVPLFSMGLYPDELSGQVEQTQAWAEENLGGSIRSGSWVITLDGFFAGLARISKDEGSLELILLYPLETLENRIQRQRLAVGLAVLTAVGLLGLFSWYFTGRLLRPIQENQQRQYQFTAAASHELRTPLTAILSATSAWERAECLEPARGAQFSDIIRREGKRMARLIDDLLTLAGADCQSWELRPQKVELDMLLLEAYENNLPLAREKGLTLSLALPEQAGFPVWADRERLMQVLAVLLDNAMGYTPAPGSVRLEMDYGRNTARITVTDTGPGVPEEEKKRIFERFHRAEKARSDRAHFGLGLSIAAEIIRLHKGRIWVEDGENGGAAFQIELPQGGQ